MEEFEQIMLRVLKPWGNAPVYNCMLSIKDEKRGQSFSRALGTTGEKNNAVTPEYRFRTGSITKLFTATIIFQLLEEGLLDLEDLYFDLINKETINLLSRLHFSPGLDRSGEISINQLLHHSSGLPDYYADDERFLKYVMEHPSQAWNWKLVMEKYFEFQLNLKPPFAPGTGFHYSDTNYLLLAILIEQITNKSLQQVFKEKIFDPLALKGTYLEFYELPYQIKPTVYPYYGIHSLETINTSFDWGAGGLISTMNDLDIFIRSLLRGSLFKNAETLDHLMHFQNKYLVNGETGNRVQYGPGIQKKEMPGYSFFGHSSAYGSLLFYDPDKDFSIFLSLNQAAAVPKAEWLFRKIILEFESLTCSSNIFPTK